jgi:hypothetical protein
MGESQRRRRAFLLSCGVAVVAAALLVAFLLSRDDGREPGIADPAAAVAAPGADAPATAATGPGAPSARPASGDAGAPATGEPSAFAIVASWGSGPNELGRSRPEEGNPEAPMSFAFDPFGRPLVLDQVNGRIVRHDASGKATGSFPVTQQAPQDLAVARDGTTATLDRLVDKSVALLDAEGRLLGELPVEGKGIEEGGGVTGIFIDGEEVYLEREHGDLVKIGDTKGNADPERPEIPGRPSRDGLSYLSAGLVDAAEGRLFVNSVDRATREHRYTRELRMGLPAPAIVLLDTDLRGNVYLGALLETAPGGEGPPSFLIRVVCLQPTDGQPWGSVEMPASSGVEESFRDLVVLDGGGLIQALRTPEGITYLRRECR